MSAPERDMLHRVATAICTQAFGYSRPMQSDFDIARAALDAMREPTAAMVDAGAKHENRHSYQDTRAIYGAMIRAAATARTTEDAS